MKFSTLGAFPFLMWKLLSHV